MGFFKNIFGKKDGHNEEDFAKSEMKKERMDNFGEEKNISSSSSSFSFNEKSQNDFSDQRIDENEENQDSVNIKNILNSVMESLEDGSEAKEKLKQKLHDKNFNNASINIVTNGSYIVEKVMKNGKTVKTTEKKSGDLDDNTMEMVNDIIINVLKK